MADNEAEKAQLAYSGYAQEISKTLGVDVQPSKLQDFGGVPINIEIKTIKGEAETLAGELSALRNKAGLTEKDLGFKVTDDGTISIPQAGIANYEERNGKGSLSEALKPVAEQMKADVREATGRAQGANGVEPGMLLGTIVDDKKVLSEVGIREVTDAKGEVKTTGGVVINPGGDFSKINPDLLAAVTAAAANVIKYDPAITQSDDYKVAKALNNGKDLDPNKPESAAILAAELIARNTMGEGQTKTGTSADGKPVTELVFNDMNTKEDYKGADGKKIPAELVQQVAQVILESNATLGKQSGKLESAETIKLDETALAPRLAEHAKDTGAGR